MKRSPAHWILLALAGGAVAGFLLFGFFVSPSEEGHGTHEKLGLPPCLAMEVFGVPCPGCGVTTSVALASRGRIRDSFRNQPFGLVVALLGAALVPWAIWGHARGRDLWDDFKRMATTPVLTVLTLTLLAAWGYKLCLTFAWLV